MPNLVQSLQSRDLGHLRIVAGLWGLELVSAETEAALKELTEGLLNRELAGEIVESLPAGARAALAELAAADGKMPWAVFARQFGEIREAGPGRRDREQVFLHPASAAETLFYRALLARAFFDTPRGALEFAYIPDDLKELIKHEGEQGNHEKPLESSPVEAPGRLATPKERERLIPASDRLLDDATTFLAALRMGIEPPELQVPAGVVKEFLLAANILNGEAAQPEQVKSFLEMQRLQALHLLRQAWEKSGGFNELRQVPGLVCEGEWTNQPLATRSFLFHLLETLPEGKWWSLPAFIRGIQEQTPDFQRPAGDYDSWFIKRLSDGTYLRGFGSWDEVDGALIRYIITGPMFWLGVVELARPEEHESITAFRVNVQRGTSDEKGRLTVSSNGRISVPRLLPRAARYQMARFCEWDEAKADEYRYRVTTSSLQKARQQGLKAGQLLSLLAKYSTSGIPPAFVKALKRWESNGTEARIEVQTILRVSRPEVLEELRNSKARRFLGEELGPVSVIVKPGAEPKVLAALAELGLLAEATTST